MSFARLLPRDPASFVSKVALACLLFLFTTLSPIRADVVNLTGAENSRNIAEIYILEGQIKVVLEVFVEDIGKFKELVPDRWLEGQGVTRPDLAQRMRQFSARGLQFVTPDGRKLQAQRVKVDLRLRKERYSPLAGTINPYTRQRIPAPPSDKRVMYVELTYPLEGQLPESLTIAPPQDENGEATAAMGFIVFHKIVPIIDFRYLGAPSRVVLDWDDPWYSKFDNPRLYRKHKSAVMSFLYVEPYEVRHEVLTRVKDLENWMDLGLRGERYIEADEIEPLKKRIVEFLLEKNLVRIDGKLAEPILDRSNYLQINMSGLQYVENPKRLEISTALTGVTFAYITDGMPQKVNVEWELFTDQIQMVPFTAYDPAGPLWGLVDPSDSIGTWTNYLKKYRIPTVEHVSVDASLVAFSVSLLSVLGLLGLVPVYVLFRARRKNAKPTGSLLGIAAALIVSAPLLWPFTQVQLYKPAAMAPTLTDANAKAILQVLLKNVYRAFDFRKEDRVYDKLAISVSGDMLSDIYLQSRTSFEVQRAGGAQAKIKQVEVLDVKAERNPDQSLGYDLNAKWFALGTVNHWGHTHTRKNLYNALVTIGMQDGQWKITNMDIVEEDRVDLYNPVGQGDSANKS